MPPSKTRYITACQQMLALGVVLAALTPAASVVSLDVVREVPGAAPANVGHLSAYARAATGRSVVPTEPVDPTVTEHVLTAAPVRPGARAVRPPVEARTRSTRPGVTEVVSDPQDVRGYGAVGVTWAAGQAAPEDALSFEVRTRTGSTWSDWSRLAYDADEGPDPDSDEGRHARPGTDPMLVGDVEQVQVRALATHGEVPAGMELAVIDPGETEAVREESPAIDTDTLASAATTAPATAAPPAGTAATPSGAERTTATGLAPSAATYTPTPKIYSRAQWGADERMRDASSLHYFEVHAGFVHHTVNANSYTREEVPGIIRGIYAYHTRSKGWSDIGYNFLVDRFGRIWEGRYGGVDRPVVGAHTLGYNDYAFAMSAIGNYDIAQPSDAIVEAYGALFAWKLSLHGVDASSTSQQVGPDRFQAINGHRDAGQTACPGRYLYAKIPRIRQLAAEAQRGWSGRELESDLAASPHPDLVVRRASDQQAFVIPTGGLSSFGSARTVTAQVGAGDTVVASPDLTSDGHDDLLVRDAGGTARVLPGNGQGAFGAPVKSIATFARRDLITAVGDLDGDGGNDMVARRPSGRLDLYRGGGRGGFAAPVSLGTGWGGFTAIAATGDLDGDGRADLLVRDADNRMWLRPGLGGTRLGGAVPVPGRWGRYATTVGYGDFNGDGRRDLLAAETGGATYLLPARGDGTFGRRLGPFTVLRGATVLAGGDLTGTGASDVLARKGTGLVVYPSAGTYETGVPIATGVKLPDIDALLNAGDWDRDGLGDLVTRQQSTGSLFLRSGNGRGGFGPGTRIATGFGNVRLLAAVGDMTGDGWPDLMGQPSGASMRIYPGRGASGLAPSYVAYRSVDASEQIGVGRWDEDGAPDSLFRKGDGLTLTPGNGPGGLTGAKALPLDLAPYDWVVGVSDVTLSGHPDLIVRARATGYLWLLRGTPTGFAPREFLGEGMKPYDLAG
jgi:hypothetical protein